jgi:hypothetical protein
VATYDSLTAEQKADLDAYDKFLRGSCRVFNAAMGQIDPENWHQFALDNIDPILATLDPAEVIPTTYGGIGAKTLTAQETKDLQTAARTILQLMATNKSLTVKAAGP